MVSPHGRSRRRVLFAWTIAYAVAMAVVVTAMLYVRDSTLRGMATPEARAQWQAWRDAQPNQAGTGPVERHPPAVAEPPGLLLMRDHFTVMMTGALGFGSLLFAAISLAARAVFFSPSKP